MTMIYLSNMATLKHKTLSPEVAAKKATELRAKRLQGVALRDIVKPGELFVTRTWVARCVKSGMTEEEAIEMLEKFKEQNLITCCKVGSLTGWAA